MRNQYNIRQVGSVIACTDYIPTHEMTVTLHSYTHELRSMTSNCAIEATRNSNRTVHAELFIFFGAEKKDVKHYLVNLNPGVGRVTSVCCVFTVWLCVFDREI